ncbi:hypothetical protein QJQ45_001166 [Haematococcus lacustris]|nr:hypothetical protein QJQ45_001166 [Haematococcus lacustris]
MQGLLTKYGPGPSHLAFISHHHHKRHLVLLGGLTDGLMFASYVPPLAAGLAVKGWSLVQAQLSSSYQGFGCSCLDQDAEELRLLLHHLTRAHASSGLVLMGHSTGCQGVTRFMQQHASSSSGAAVKAAPQPGDEGAAAGAGAVGAPRLPLWLLAMQWLAMHPELLPQILTARDFVAQGRGAEVVGRLQLLDGAPVTAQRLCALCDLGGDDDMYSMDFTAEELQARLAPLGTLPCLVMLSGEDEAVPDTAKIPGHASRLAAAIGGDKARAEVVSGAPHNLAGLQRGMFRCSTPSIAIRSDQTATRHERHEARGIGMHEARCNRVARLLAQPSIDFVSKSHECPDDPNALGSDGLPKFARTTTQTFGGKEITVTQVYSQVKGFNTRANYIIRVSLIKKLVVIA